MYLNKERLRNKNPQADQPEAQVRMHEWKNNSRQRISSQLFLKDMITKSERCLMYLFQKLFKS